MANIQQNVTTDACPSPSTDDLQNNETKNDLNSQEPTYNKKTADDRCNRKHHEQENKYVINISNSNGIHIGSNYTINNVSKETYRKKKNSMPKTEAVNKLLSSNEFVTTDNLVFVSTNVEEGWRNIGRYFNFSDGQIDQFYESHIHSGIKEVVYQMLLTWFEQEPHEATVGKLAIALWSCGQKDVVKRWSACIEEDKL